MDKILITRKVIADNNILENKLKINKPANVRELKVKDDTKRIPLKEFCNGAIPKKTEIVAIKNGKEEKKCLENVQKSQFFLIRNIDLPGEYENDECMMLEYANDIYSYLRSLEIKYAIKENYLSGHFEITAELRLMHVDWINEVHFQLNLVTDIYYMAVSIFDLFLQKVPLIKKDLLQLVGATALFIASKYEDHNAPELKEFSYMTADTCSTKEILLMERKIIKALNYNLGRPLHIYFLRRFSKAANATNMIYQCAKYISELSTIEYSFSWYKPSKIAAASVFLSLILFDKSEESNICNIWTPTLQFYTCYNVLELTSTMKKLAIIVINAPTSKYKSVYEKYMHSEFERISFRLYTQKNLDIIIDWVLP